MLKTSAKSKGFTLIELLIVVAIVGILASISMLQFSSYRLRSSNAAAVSDLRSFRLVLDSYYEANLTYP